MSDSGMGLVYEARMPTSWQPRDAASDDLQAAYEQAERVLRMLTLAQEQRRELPEEEGEHSADLARIEAKLDLMIGLLLPLVNQRSAAASERQVRLASEAVEIAADPAAAASPDQSLWVELYLDRRFPWALRLPVTCQPVAPEREGHWMLLRFDSLPEGVNELLEKLIFRQHRRQIAQLRAGS